MTKSPKNVDRKAPRAHKAVSTGTLLDERLAQVRGGTARWDLQAPPQPASTEWH